MSPFRGIAFVEGAQCSSETRFHSAAYQLQGRASAPWLRSTPSDPHERGHSAAALAKALDAQGTGSTRDVDHRGREREESDVSRKCVAGQSHGLSHTFDSGEKGAPRPQARARTHERDARRQFVPRGAAARRASPVGGPQRRTDARVRVHHTSLGFLGRDTWSCGAFWSARVPRCRCE